MQPMFINRLCALLVRLWATRQRQLGLYQAQTLAAFYRAWRYQPSAQNLLAWASFRRDLGWPLSYRLAQSLQQQASQLSVPQRTLALGMLAETQRLPPQQALPPQWHEQASHKLPALASLFGLGGSLNPLHRVAAMQPAWRHSFAHKLSQAVAERGVAVVGNASALRGGQLGPTIDAASCVVRFNQFPQDNNLRQDVGQKTNVWVVAPGYKGPTPQQVDWVILSGPAMEFRLSNWSFLESLLNAGTPVLTVPLHIWRDCVSTLHAPPSGGVLVLCWIHQLLNNNWAGISAAGIGMHSQSESSYHIVSRSFKPSARHCWAAEAALVNSWRKQGLHTPVAPTVNQP